MDKNAEEQNKNNQNINSNEEENIGDEILDDDYLIQLHRYLQEVKNQRKNLENDTNLLDGRLRCLRDEQTKTNKKIEVTRKKTEQKKAQIQEADEKMRKKNEFRTLKQLELEKKKEQNKVQNENNRQAILNKQEERKRQMDEDMQNLKDQKKTNLELKQYIAIEDLSNKKTQADYIKSQTLMAEEKKRAIELEKKNKIKEDLENKIREEELRIQQAEARKANLEVEEIEIMEKLKTTTKMHEALVENYEKLSSNKNANNQSNPNSKSNQNNKSNKKNNNNNQ